MVRNAELKSNPLASCERVAPSRAAAAIGRGSNVEMGQARFVGVAAFLSAIHLGSEWVSGERVVKPESA